MELHYFQKGFNYSQDGPGNRLVYHLCGCNLICPWCSNPEGMTAGSSLSRSEPLQAVEKSILSARPMFFDGGGVTFTGGEPTLQLAAVEHLFARLREQGVHTCVETNATSPAFDRLLKVLDHLIADFKHPDSQEHLHWTGLPNDQIKRNLRLAAESSLPVQLRVPLIHGVNDSDQALEGFVAFFSSISRPGLSVEFLPYHEYGREKWRQINKNYTMEDGFVTPQRVQLFESTCKAAGICIIRT